MDEILAIDPGPQRSAYVLWDGKTILQHATVLNQELLEFVDGLGYHYQVVIEWITGYGMTVGREVFDTCRWVGRFQQIAGDAELLPRRRVKRILCENDGANDSHVRQALIDKVGAPGTKKQPGPTYGLKGDEWAALAVAVAWEELNHVKE